MSGRVTQAERGQALIETAAFLPLLLLAMVAIIYFSQFGVLQERAGIAARYASLVSNASTSSTSPFTLAKMYAELRREGNNSTLVAAPAGSSQCAPSAQGDAQQTLVQQQPLAEGTIATAPPYFSPTANTGTTCVSNSLSLTPSSGGGDIASAYYSVQYTHVGATQTVPTLLQPVIGNLMTSVSSGMSNVKPSSPENILYCAPGFAQAIAISLGPEEPAPQAGPYAGYATPPPGKLHVC